MNPSYAASPSLDELRGNLVALGLPRALEVLNQTMSRLEHGEIAAVEAMNTLLGEERLVREDRRTAALFRTSRMPAMKTIAAFDFAFQPSLDRERIRALASLGFMDRAECVHFIGQSGCGKTHLALALGVEAIRRGRAVMFFALADLIETLVRAEREGKLREKVAMLCRPALLIVDEIGYLQVPASGGNLFFQLVNARYEKGSMILTSNRAFSEWGRIFGSDVVASAVLDRLLHHASVVRIEGSSYRLREHAALLPNGITMAPEPPVAKRRGRPPKILTQGH